MYPQKGVDPNPLSIILVKSDSKGARLLFRYPYAADTPPESLQHNQRKNPYALTIAEDLLQSPPPQTSNISKGHLTGFTDEVLSTLFAVKAMLCERKFELKVNDVRFVGHPTLLPSSGAADGGAGDCVAGRPKESNPPIILIHIVFALRATASRSVVKCYYDLSKRLGVALRHEERRCGYLSAETRAMVAAHDEPDAPFDLILQRCPLARDLRAMYEDLCSTGLVHVRVNRWIEVSFCLPQKVHRFHKDSVVEPEVINRCLQSLRPYHSILLLVDPVELINSLPPDSSPALMRLALLCSPLRSLQTLAADAELSLLQVFQLAGHLLYWAKATVIYPLCESNVYVIAPYAPDAHLMERFSEQFPGMNLLQVMADFSLPSSVGQRSSPFGHPQQQQQLVQALVWMLRHRILLQLHTYVNCFPTPNGLGSTVVGSRHSLAGAGPGDAGSFQSTPDERLSLSASGGGGTGGVAGSGRAASESDLSDDMAPVPAPRSYGRIHSGPVHNGTLEGYYEYLGGGTAAGGRPGGGSSPTWTEDDASFLSPLLLPDENGGKGLFGGSLLQEELLAGFSEEERASILRIPASTCPEDLQMLVRLYRRGYFDGHHHLEEIMYLENLRRSTLLQLLDKFRDILVIHEAEDPVIAMLYPQCHS